MVLGHICELENCCPDKLEKYITHPSPSTSEFNAYTSISIVLNIIIKEFIHLLNVSFLLLEEEILVDLRIYGIIKFIIYIVFQFLLNYRRLSPHV